MPEIPYYDSLFRLYFSAEEIDARLKAEPGNRLGSLMEQKGWHVTLNFVGEIHPDPFVAVLTRIRFSRHELRDPTLPGLLQSVELALADLPG